MSAGSVPIGALDVAGALPVEATASPRVEAVVAVAAFAALRDEWDLLLADSPSDSLFLTWEWLHTWWTHLSRGRELAVLAVRRGNRLEALAPFASSGANLLGLPRLEFLGSGRVGSDYLDVIVRRGAGPDVVASLASHLMRRGVCLDLRQVRIPASATGALARGLRQSGCAVRATRSHRCPVIDLRGRSWEAYLGSLGREHRRDFQRKLRKLEQRHDLRFERVVAESRRRELLPVLFELHRLRWSERGGSDGLEGAGLREFHEELTRLALERGWLRLFVLWLGASPAAALYGFRYGEVFSFYQSGLDPRYRKLSVGLVAMGLAIKSAIEEGAAEFDLLHGEEAYKFHWARSTRRLGRVRAFPGGPRGHLACQAADLLDALRRLRRRLAIGAAAGGWAARAGGSRAAPAR